MVRIISSVVKAFLHGALALPVFLAGKLIGRPWSAIWLHHYLTGDGADLWLPPELVEQSALVLAFLVQDRERYDIPPVEVGEKIVGWPQWLPAYEEAGIPVDPQAHEDLFTTVGAFAARYLGEGVWECWDRYDWERDDGWCFTVQLGPLPFSFEVRGRDEWLRGRGREFTTRWYVTGVYA